MTESEIVLDVRGLGKSYGGVVAVEEVSFSVRAGEIVGLVGPNGAGKTTIIDMITGVQGQDSGAVFLRGEPLSGPTWRRARRGLARSFQHPQLASGLSLRQNIVLGGFMGGFGTVGSVVREMIEGLIGRTGQSSAIGLAAACRLINLDDLDRMGHDLPLGEKRLAEVARALMQHPKLLILDEPFAGSDGHGAEGLSNAIRTLRAEGHSALVVDHNVDLVADLVDRVILLNLGKVVFEGTPEACLASDEMRAVYFGNRRKCA